MKNVTLVYIEHNAQEVFIIRKISHVAQHGVARHNEHDSWVAVGIPCLEMKPPLGHGMSLIELSQP